MASPIPRRSSNPYDLTVSMMAPDQRDGWGRRVVSDLQDRFGELEGKVFEVHAGEAYRRAIEGPLHAAGATIVAPLAGLQIGEQLNWYDKARTGQRARQPATPAAPATPAHGMDLDIEQVRRLGPFSHDWPASTQRFEGGWEYLAAAGDQRFQIRHATGYAETYGQRRLHSVTFVRGEPVVEGVAADDYLDTFALISLLRVPGSQRHVRDRGSVPAGYAEFELVFHDEEIRAYYSPQSLAVKIREDDLRAWAAHALLRLSQSQRQRRTVISSVRAAQHLVDHGEPLDSERRAAVVAGLLRFGEALDERYAEGFELAHEPEADALLANDHSRS